MVLDGIRTSINTFLNNEATNVQPRSVYLCPFKFLTEDARKRKEKYGREER